MDIASRGTVDGLEAGHGQRDTGGAAAGTAEESVKFAGAEILSPVLDVVSVGRGRDGRQLGGRAALGGVIADPVAAVAGRRVDPPRRIGPCVVGGVFFDGVGKASDLSDWVASVPIG